MQYTFQGFSKDILETDWKRIPAKGNCIAFSMAWDVKENLKEGKKGL